ncbi:helix-turn-helix domain-containing protein [uncultured Enterococcus sp.]|uniref:helix-turn-helix domain-containing protein n=1 Tax=uncultured Enterococcus sp. TaxID=167972 RepID=UPI002AA8F072|nr:helix-turn-helix domain-containing protein [uncultured Enterococcus sp.]
METKIYLNKKQTCEFIGIDNNTLDKWIHKYNFPFIRIGGIIRFETQDIKNFMDMFKVL